MEYVDLGLPSGKLWATENEEGYFTFAEAVNKFQDQLPTDQDFSELLFNTENYYDSERKGFVLTSIVNGKELFLPAEGYQFKSEVKLLGTHGFYWAYSKQYRCSHFEFRKDYASVFWTSNPKVPYTVRLIK